MSTERQRQDWTGIGVVLGSILIFAVPIGLICLCFGLGIDQ